MSDEGEVLGEVGTALVFENDRVKVWQLDLEPGEESAVHHHDMDYVLVVVDGDRIAGVSAGEDGGRVMESAVESGQVFYIRRGGTELARNTGRQRYREILIELKD